jgi:hypothetical protein
MAGGSANRREQHLGPAPLMASVITAGMERIADGVLSAPKPIITINIARFWGGATAREIIDTILPDLEPYFDFQISNSPQVLLYGPYTGEMPRGAYTRVFIGCENLRPIMSECDWAFGVENEARVGHPRYMRLERWGDDSLLIRPDRDPSALLAAKTRFCAFIYGVSHVYRNEFFHALSRYKHVDAPGPVLNNMPSFDPVPGQPDWGAKVEFLRQYKFVVAFENASVPGYHTEKLTHAIEADCLPIYWGDPEIGDAFNTARFINANDYLPSPRRFLPRLPYAPHSLRSQDPPGVAARIARRFNGTMYRTEQRSWAAAGFEKLIEQIVAADNDDELYLRYLREPFLIGNRPPDRSRWIARWREIFEQSLA